MNCYSDSRLRLLSCLLLICCLGAAGCDGPTSDASQAKATETAVPANAPSSEPQINATPAVNGSGPPLITFAKTTYDFGRISEIHSVPGKLTFTNTGGETLTMGEVKTSCGCTAARPDKRNYQPGESGFIDIVFDPAGPGEDQLKYVNVFSNAANTEEGGLTKLKITADVDPFISIEPRQHKFGVFEYGKPHTLTVQVASADPNMELERLKLTNKLLTMEVIDNEPPEDGGVSKSINVHIPENAPWGSMFSWLEVTARAKPSDEHDEISHMARVRIQGLLFDKLHATPEKFRFGSKPGEAIERRIVLKHVDQVPFTVEASLDDYPLPDAKVTVVPVSPYEYTLTFTATNGTKLGQYRGFATIHTDIEGEETLQIPIEGVARRMPRGVK